MWQFYMKQMAKAQELGEVEKMDQLKNEVITRLQGENDYLKECLDHSYHHELMTWRSEQKFMRDFCHEFEETLNLFSRVFTSDDVMSKKVGACLALLGQYKNSTMCNC